MHKQTWLFLVIITLVCSCKKEEINPKTTNFTLNSWISEVMNDYYYNFTVNSWISEVMNDYYYWYKKIPSNKIPTEKIEPEEYFKSLLYTEEDKWSFITNDYTGLMAEYQGTPISIGYTPTFGQFYNSDRVFIIVTSVYKNSSAEKAGLKRGDIILKIDNQYLTTSNYIDLFSKTSYSVTLGLFNGQTINETDITKSLSATQLIIDPVLSDTIYQNFNGKNIGYLCISEFLDEDPFITQVKPSIDKYKANGIRDLVIDLRYNRGGSMDAAIWLASALAPQSVINNKSVLVELIFNDKLQPYMESIHESSYPFDHTITSNLDLDHIYFLTTKFATASASELVIIGLKPYMNVIQIGENTVGKYTGMFAIPDTETPARHNYGLMPIVMKYANALGVTDFKDGLVPDIFVEDDLLNSYPFGDTHDPQLETALELITGYVKSGKTAFKPTQPFKRLCLPNDELKSNLLVK